MAAPRPPAKPKGAGGSPPRPALFCTQCGRSYGDTDRFCVDCGAPRQRAESESREAQTTTEVIPRKHRLRRSTLILLASAVGLIVILRLVFTFVTVNPLSTAQQELVEVFGHPSQFSIAYVPGGTEDDEIAVRSEVWYYPDHGQQVTFLSGTIISVDEMPVEEAPVVYPDLHPEQFDIDMTLDEVAALAGPEVALVEAIPGDTGDLELYAGEGALFAMERGQLVFLQTIGVLEGG